MRISDWSSDVCSSDLVSDNVMGSGATGAPILSHAVHKVASPGTSRMPASAIPSRARLRTVQPSASRISKLTEASSRKSTESANSETDPISSATAHRSEEHTSELQSLMRISYAVFCLNKNKKTQN